MTKPSEQRANGEAHVVDAGQSIQIVFTREPYAVQLVAPGVELVMAIAVLRTALDELEAQLRMARIAAAQQAQADQALVGAIRQSIKQ